MIAPMPFTKTMGEMFDVKGFFKDQHWFSKIGVAWVVVKTASSMSSYIV